MPRSIMGDAAVELARLTRAPNSAAIQKFWVTFLFVGTFVGMFK